MNKILIISNSSYSLLSFRRELLESFLERNFSIVVCCPQDASTPFLLEEFERLKIKVIIQEIRNTSKNIIFDFLTFLRFVNIIKSNNITHTFSYNMKPVIYGSIAAYFCGLKHIYTIVTGLGYTFTENNGISITRLLLKNLLTFALSLNEKIFFQNKNDFDYLCKTKKLQNSSIIVNGSGVDTEFFKFTKTPKEISFLFVGRLLAHKGIYEYIEAVRLLKKKYPTISFKVAGGFSSNPSAVTQVELESWIHEEIIEYLGEVQEMLPVFQKASVCVLPSYREGCPRSLLEAMSVGRAIITTDAPGCRDTVIEGNNGYLVPVKNSLKLAEAMEQLIASPSLIKKMGQKSRLLAEEKFNVHKVNERILKGMGL
jgi:glycosyltransferase involved in cell wall biosynthesis